MPTYRQETNQTAIGLADDLTAPVAQ